MYSGLSVFDGFEIYIYCTNAMENKYNHIHAKIP